MSSDNVLRNPVQPFSYAPYIPQPEPQPQPQQNVQENLPSTTHNTQQSIVEEPTAIVLPPALTSAQRYILSLTQEQRAELERPVPQLIEEDGSITFYPPSSRFFLPTVFERYYFNALSREDQQEISSRYPGWRQQLSPELRCGNKFTCKFNNSFSQTPKRVMRDFLQSIDINSDNWIQLSQCVIQLAQTHTTQIHSSRAAFQNTFKTLAKIILTREIFTTQRTPLKENLFQLLEGCSRDLLHVRICQLKNIFFPSLIQLIFRNLPREMPELWLSEIPQTPVNFPIQANTEQN